MVPDVIPKGDWDRSLGSQRIVLAEQLEWLFGVVSWVVRLDVDYS